MGPETQRRTLAPADPEMLTRLGYATFADPLLRAAAGLPAGWTVIPDCILPPVRPGQKLAHISAVLLHPGFGIVLLEFEPSATPDAEERLRLCLKSALDAAEREAIPILHLRLAPNRADRLGRALEHALGQWPAARRVSDEHWMRRVVTALLDLARCPAAPAAPPSDAARPERQPIRTGTWAGVLAGVGVGAAALLAVTVGSGQRPGAPPTAPNGPAEAAPRLAAAFPDRAGPPLAAGPMPGERDLKLAAAPPRLDPGLKDEDAAAPPAPPAVIGLGMIVSEPDVTMDRELPEVARSAVARAESPPADTPPPEPDTFAGSEPWTLRTEPTPAAAVEMPLPETEAVAAPEPWTLRAEPMPAAAVEMPLPETEAVAAPEPWTLRTEPTPTAAAEVPLPEAEAVAGPEPWTLRAEPMPAAPVEAPLPEAEAVAGPEPWTLRAEPMPAAPVEAPLAETEAVAAPEPWTLRAEPMPAAPVEAPLAEAEAVASPEPRTLRAEPVPAAPVEAPLAETEAVASPEPRTLRAEPAPAAPTSVGDPPGTAAEVPAGPRLPPALPRPPDAEPPRVIEAMRLPPPPVVLPRPPAAPPAGSLAAALPRPMAPPPDARQSTPAATRAAPPTVQMAPAMIAALTRRGDQMLAIGDISAARLLYERAAAAGSGAAALALGRTYDPAAMAQLGARGLRPDPETAAAWYRRAQALGEQEAEPLLRALPGGGR